MEEVCEIRAKISYVPLFETFASNQPFICNSHQTMKQCEGLNKGVNCSR